MRGCRHSIASGASKSAMAYLTIFVLVLFAFICGDATHNNAIVDGSGDDELVGDNKA